MGEYNLESLRILGDDICIYNKLILGCHSKQ